MASTTLWNEFESLWVQLGAKEADVGPKVLDAVRKLRLRHDSDRELHQQQQSKLQEKQKQAFEAKQERFEQRSSKFQDQLREGASRLADLREKLARQEEEARLGEERAQNVRLELREVRKEVADTRHRLQVAADETDYLKSRHADQWSKLAQERDGISTELAPAAERLAEERAQAEKARLTLEKCDNEIDATRQELGVRQAELAKLNEMRQAIDERKGQDSAGTRAQINSVKAQLQETRAAQEALLSGVEQRRNSLNVVADWRRRLEETQRQTIAGISSAAENVATSSKATEELLRLGDEISQTRTSLLLQRSSVTAESSQLSDLKAEQARKLGELQATVKFVESDCEAAKEAVMLAECKRSSLPIATNDPSKLAEDERQTAERISKLEDTSLEIKKQLPGLQAQLNSTQEVLQNRLSKVAGLKYRASDAQENLDTIRAQITRAKEQGVRLQKRLELQESTTEEISAMAVPIAEMAAARNLQEQKLKETALHETLNSLAERAKDVSDNVSEGNRTIAQLRQKDKGWMSEPRRYYNPPSRAPQESIPECASDDGKPIMRKPSPPPAENVPGGGLMSRLDALAISVNSMCAENNELEARIRSPSPSASLGAGSSAGFGREHLRTLPTKPSVTSSTTPPSTEGGYKDSMSSPRNSGGREYDQERRAPYDVYQTSVRRQASPSGRQRSPSPGFGGGGYRSHAFEHQHTIPELSHGVSNVPFQRGRSGGELVSSPRTYNR